MVIRDVEAHLHCYKNVLNENNNKKIRMDSERLIPSARRIMIPRNFYTLSSRYVEEGESPFSN
jgi:hypothetical protein